jgi:hypothetical protein
MYPTPFKLRLSPKWVIAALAALIGTASGWILCVTAIRLFFEYVYYPQAKAQDACIYPEWRYLVFDTVLVAWCLDGLLASVLLIRSLALREGIGGWARRTTLMFFACFGMLVLAVGFGIWLRSHGI